MQSAMTKRQFAIFMSTTPSVVDAWIRHGFLKAVKQSSKVMIEPLLELRENFHYVECRDCRQKMMMLSDVHLSKCVSGSTHKYMCKYPDAPLLCDFTRGCKVKTEVQKTYQSQVLKRRFKTPEGELTKRQISKASLQRLQDPKQYEIALRTLRGYNDSASGREQSRKLIRKRLGEGLLEQVRKWHKENRDLSLQLAARARTFQRKKITKPHLAFKKALEERGLKSQTEFQVGFYSVDEAFPELKIAVEIDGCYWHGCEACGFKPFRGTQKTDKTKTTFLSKDGWEICRIKTCEAKMDVSACVDRVFEIVNRRQHGQG